MDTIFLPKNRRKNLPKFQWALNELTRSPLQSFGRTREAHTQTGGSCANCHFILFYFSLQNFATSIIPSEYHTHAQQRHWKHTLHDYDYEHTINHRTIILNNNNYYYFILKNNSWLIFEKCFLQFWSFFFFSCLPILVHAAPTILLYICMVYNIMWYDLWSCGIIIVVLKHLEGNRMFYFLMFHVQILLPLLLN